MTPRVRIAAELACLAVAILCAACVSHLEPEVRPDRPVPPPWRVLARLRAADAACWAVGAGASVAALGLIVAGVVDRRGRTGRGPGGGR